VQVDADEFIGINCVDDTNSVVLRGYRQACRRTV